VPIECNSGYLTAKLSMKSTKTVRHRRGDSRLTVTWIRLRADTASAANVHFEPDNAHTTVMTTLPVARPIGELSAAHAHTVAVDRTHRVYLPLENVDGRPVLRILTP
jgi:hypothetical protein